LGIKIIGTGTYIPEKVIANDDFSKIVDTSDEWITSRTGIKRRHFADNITTFKMGANAAEIAIKKAGLLNSDIDIIIATTATPDYLTPSTAYLIANELGLTDVVALDINCACAAFIYALDIAKRYLADGEYKNALIVSTEMLSKITDFTDRSTCVLFGDGAGAVVVNKSDGLFTCHLGGDASGVSKLFARGVEPSHPFMEKPFDRMSDGFAKSNGNALYMDGRDVYKFATRVMPLAITKACEKAGISTEDISLVIPHQANRRIIETAAKNLKLPLDRFYINIEEYGNMSSACIPVCLSQALEKNQIKKGDMVCFVGFGAGLTYGASIIEWE